MTEETRGGKLMDPYAPREREKTCSVRVLSFKLNVAVVVVVEPATS